MPGIVGIIRRQPYEGIDGDLDKMLAAMRHKAYYAGDKYVNRDIGLHVGWWSHPRCLGAQMPLIAQDGGVILIVIGEHFSHSCASVPKHGKEADDRTVQDLLRLYRESENGFFNSLNGWFCGVLVDTHLGRTTLFNDRYGMGRIYCHEGNDEFIFASEAKSLLRIRPALRAIEPESLAQYLRFNCVMGNKTLFKSISLLPGASSWSFSGSVIPEKGRYFDYATWEQRPAVAAAEFHEKFDELVSGILPSYMDNEQSVALSLTAGLDTRAILAAARERRQGFPCYTFGGLWGETFDIRTARKLAAACDWPHETIRIDERFLREFPHYAKQSVYISDGTHDALGAHDVYFNEVAHKIAPIRLTGKFGSEVVRTRRLIPSCNFPRHLLQPGFLPILDKTPDADHFTQRIHPLSRVVAEEIAWYEFGRVSVEQSEVILRTPYMDNELVQLMYQAPPGLRDSRDLQAKYVRRKSEELADVPTNMGRVRQNGQLTGTIAYSLFWALFKAEFIYLYATPHWLTRLDRKLEWLKPERIIAGRQKFEGYRIWMKTHLAEFIRDVLNSRARCTDLFDKAWVEKVVVRHTAGTHNYLNEINKMLTIELIYSSLLSP